MCRFLRRKLAKILSKREVKNFRSNVEALYYELLTLLFELTLDFSYDRTCCTGDVVWKSFLQHLGELFY
jgi:hypothetical protein